ncbi:MAG: ABC transporter ATP-binding protein [Candidatus Micrarchaeia archaeon]
MEKVIMRIENVSLRRPLSGPVLENISFDVYEGEFLSIVGMSGTGKTTLLQALAGILPCASGSIYYKDELIIKPRVEIGLVFQNYALFPWRTALENVEFGLEIRNVPMQKRRQIAMEALDLLGVGNSKDKYPIELSGGMQQRVAIAREIVNKPKILMLDEGFSALDVTVRRQTERYLLDFQRRFGMTIILVTHMVDQALSLSNRVIVLSDGGIKKIIRLAAGRRPRNIDKPSFRRLLHETEVLLKPTSHMDVFVKDLKSI